jgi:hypothetical protein
MAAIPQPVKELFDAQTPRQRQEDQQEDFGTLGHQYLI